MAQRWAENTRLGGRLSRHRFLGTLPPGTAARARAVEARSWKLAQEPMNVEQPNGDETGGSRRTPGTG